MTDPIKQRLYVDTDVFIYAVEGDAELAASLLAFLRESRSFPTRPVTSELTLAECLCKADQAPVARRMFMNLIVFSKLLDLMPVTRDTLIGSADLRRTMPALRLADAIHVRTAIETGCTLFMTNDVRLSLPANLRVVTPDANGLRQAIAALHV